jgi:hypothetical protein
MELADANEGFVRSGLANLPRSARTCPLLHYPTIRVACAKDIPKPVGYLNLAIGA